MTLSQDIIESRAKIAEFRSWAARQERAKILRQRRPAAQTGLDGFVNAAVRQKQAVEMVTDELVEGAV